MRVTARCVDFVPPAETDEATTGDVLEIVEVGGEKQQGDDEDEDAARSIVSNRTKGSGGFFRRTHKLLMKSTPKRYIRRAPMRKPRKQRRVIGWALRRQFRSPCCG